MAEERKPVQPIGVGDKAKTVEDLQRLMEKGQELVNETNQQKQTSPETFSQITRDLPRLIQKTLAKLEASQVYQTFKLPGRDYVVQDHREKLEEGKAKEAKETIADESKKPLKELLIQKGKLKESKEKSYENYLAGPVTHVVPMEKEAAENRLIEFFSKFEKLLLRRFEGGEEFAKPAKEGAFHFLGKTTDQWKEFFSRFTGRTVVREMAFENIHEWILRGFVQRSARATVISDWALANGQIEKFVRLRLPANAMELSAFLAALPPGARLSKEELRKFLEGDLKYLAITSGEGESNFSALPAKGKFLHSAQAEEKVASDLGVQLGAQLKEKTKLLKEKKGLRTMDHGLWTGGEELKSQFIPWWQFGPLQKRAGPARWFMPVLYLVLISLVVIGLLSLL